MSTDSKTPRTDAMNSELINYPVHGHIIRLTRFARQLETELAEANARIAELEKLVSEMTHNQRMQDSITAQVMERAEKAEAVNASLREYCRLCDIEAAERGK
jgi:hypothetical protein